MVKFRCFLEVGVGIKGARDGGKIDDGEPHKLSVNVLRLIENDASSAVIELHPEEERSLAEVFDRKFLLNLGTKTKGVSFEYNQVINMRKDPERAGGGAPENAGVGDRDGEAN
jgi:hypothetical protein